MAFVYFYLCISIVLKKEQKNDRRDFVYSDPSEVLVLVVGSGWRLKADGFMVGQNLGVGRIHDESSDYWKYVTNNYIPF